MSRWAVPNGWKWVKADDIADIIGGGTPPSKDMRNFSPDGIPWLTPADLTEYRDAYIGRGERDLSELGLSKSSARIVPKGTVLFTSRAPIGYCVVASQSLATNQGFKSLVLPDDISPEFLRYYLLASKDYAESLASGTTFRELSAARMKELEIPLAPRAEQRRIAARIEALQERSRRAREAIAEVGPLLEQLRQSVLTAAFRGDLTADWRAAHPDVEPASELLHHICVERRRLWEQAELAKYEAKGQKPPKNWKDKYEEPEPVDESELIELPKNWCWTTLESVTDPVRVIQYGILKPGPDIPEGVPYVKVKHMVGDRINISELQRTTPEIDAQYIRSRLARGDLLLSIRGTYGRLALVPDELEGANITQDSARIALLPGIHREFGAAIIRSPYIQKYFESIAKGVAVRGINIRDIRPTAIPLPPELEQIETACRINQWQESIELLEEVARDAALQFDRLDQSILAKAFRGELVPQDPNDEPASALLARIREQRAQQAEVTKGKKKTATTQRRIKTGKQLSKLAPQQLTLVEVL